MWEGFYTPTLGGPISASAALPFLPAPCSLLLAHESPRTTLPRLRPVLRRHAVRWRPTGTGRRRREAEVARPAGENLSRQGARHPFPPALLGAVPGSHVQTLRRSPEAM